MSRTALGLSFLAAFAFAVPSLAHAELINFKADMNSAQEVPPQVSAGSGVAILTLDTATKVLGYKVTYSNLTSPATAAHMHGPALPGANAGVVVPFKDPASPIVGTTPLTDAQIADLMAGKYYVNVHTSINKGGEIRGQVVKQ